MSDLVLVLNYFLIALGIIAILFKKNFNLNAGKSLAVSGILFIGYAVLHFIEYSDYLEIFEWDFWVTMIGCAVIGLLALTQKLSLGLTLGAAAVAVNFVYRLIDNCEAYFDYDFLYAVMVLVLPAMASCLLVVMTYIAAAGQNRAAAAKIWWLPGLSLLARAVYYIIENEVEISVAFENLAFDFLLLVAFFSIGKSIKDKVV